MPVQSYTLLENALFTHALWEYNKSATKTVNVTYTTFNSANITVNAVGPGGFVEARILFNGVEIGRSNFIPYAGQWDATIPITELINGPNVFKFETLKNAFIGWGDVRATVTLTVDAESQTIDIISLFEIPQWVWWVVGGTVIVGVAYVVVKKRKTIVRYVSPALPEAGRVGMGVAKGAYGLAKGGYGLAKEAYGRAVEWSEE